MPHSRPAPHPRRSLGALFILLSLLLTSCERSTSSPDTPPAPLTWTSTTAPYSLTLPTGWHAFSPDLLESGADFAASRQDRLVMVIARPVPPQLATQPPLSAFIQAALDQLREDVTDFELIEARDISLDQDTPAHLITASGKVEQNTSRYLIVLTQRDGWRYQLVTWAHDNDATDLAADLDALIASWRFLTPSSPPVTAPVTPDAAPDAGHSAQSD